MTVKLSGTELESLPDQTIRTEDDPPGPNNGNVGSSRWMQVLVRNHELVAAGDQTKLWKLLQAVREVLVPGAPPSPS